MKASRRSHVPPFAVMDILAAANARRAAGESVVSLCVGEPVTGASEVVRRRAQELLVGSDLGYTDPMGVPGLRHEIATHYQRWYGAEVNPNRVAVTTGSSGAFMLAFMAAFDTGDRVAVARPGYPAYKNILDALGCEVVEIPCGPEDEYRLTTTQLDAAVTATGRFEGLVIASPANPTGTMLRREEIAQIASWCTAHDVRLISDEIYHGIVYEPELWPGVSAIEAVADGAIVINSFSKYWAMTGWRLGWMILPDDLIAAADALAGNVALCPPTLSQQAAIAAFSDEGYAAAQTSVSSYAAARSVMLAALPRLGWTNVAPPDGAFYLYADVSSSGLSAREYCARALAEAGVALAPGEDFDSVAGSSWVRVSLAAGTANVTEAIERLVRWRSIV